MPESTDRKKRLRRREAIHGALFFAAVRLVFAAVLAWCAWLVPEPRWLRLLLGVLAVFSVASIPFVGITLRQRLKEIEGGEQDAAAQY